MIHVGQGERFGWCFHRGHDGAWELEHATPSFAAALKALTDGIEQRETAMLSFPGVYIDWRFALACFVIAFAHHSS